MNGPLTPLPHCVLNMIVNTSVGAAVEVFGPRRGNDAMAAVTVMSRTAIGYIPDAGLMGCSARARKLIGLCRGSARQHGFICRTSWTTRR